MTVKAGENEPQGGTYLLRDPDTEQVMRTGRTKNLDIRAAQHARDPLLKDLQFEIDISSDDYFVQRGREQIVHDIYRPPLNYIRPISPYNPNLDEYINAAKAFSRE